MAMELNVGKNVYKVKFGFNSFCDTDLMDRTSDLLKIFSDSGAEDDDAVRGIGKVKELFCCVRDLLYVGFQKYNPVESVQDVGDILDAYHDEAEGDEKRGILDLFTKIAEELMNEGFLGDLLNRETEIQENTIPLLQDHKKPQK